MCDTVCVCKTELDCGRRARHTRLAPRAARTLAAHTSTAPTPPGEADSARTRSDYGMAVIAEVLLCFTFRRASQLQCNWNNMEQLYIPI